MTQTLTTKVLNDFITMQGYGVAPSAVEAMARELLANREAQPVVSIGEDELNAALQLHRLKVEGHSQLSDAFRAGFKYARRTAPPAPAVPDEYEILKQAGGVQIAVKDSVTKNHLYGLGWNACRAAMLAAAPEGGK